ncbi:amidophosphoribosyltransferase [Roseobacter denitrificans]|uniref:Competence protein F, putative n=1 Tax=Roseobacter denitrificans (strain ATCC 33942 / OCh 114) TaxID=375451 RepID=Q16D28_ROSDO|nr:ComF family protein [Roseobacter denitrificans]ABG30115.1 competence protein F, putative [Roseobacter denitrificans OCh 114]AVL53309.1 amidophosphoribosyltransferase [Roseobacter denitrificans]SFF69718.1 comF family protein [Roseobacter denitrificans OCh 114]
MSQLSFQTAVSLVYPPRCLGCGGQVESDFGLCGGCWRDTPFIGGSICDSCGAPLPGDNHNECLKCDDCMITPRSWSKGRAALLYKDNARRLVLALKHGDRQEIAEPAALWMSRAIEDLPLDNVLVAPIPLHWTRLLKRRYNQSALLAQALARHAGLPVCPDLLQRQRRTQPMDGMTKEVRFTSVKGAIRAHPKRRHRMAGRPVLLVDDVFTSGATLSSATDACLAAGSGPVYVVTLARVTKNT